MKEIKLGCDVKKDENFTLDEGSFSLNNIFSIPILTLKVKDWDKKGKYLMNHYLKQSDSSKLYKRNGELLTSYHSVGDMKSVEELKAIAEEQNEFCRNLQDIFEEELSLIYDKMVKPYDRLSLRELKIGSAWFQNQNNGTSHSIHTHGSNGLSAVCYVKYDKKYHTPTIFLSPHFNTITNTNMNWSPKECVEGTLVIFPSNILHYTRPTISDISRVILSFNLFC